MFQDAVAVVTGGAKGIGKVIAQEFKKAGAHVCVIDLLPNDYFVGDVGDKAALEAFGTRGESTLLIRAVDRRDGSVAAQLQF